MNRKRNIIISSFDGCISAIELIKVLNYALEIAQNAMVYIRQCEGTDFPPYVSIERQ